ncbi:MAG: hypothetical protein RLY93_20225 [Sumerlaeia bacterium]
MSLEFCLAIGCPLQKGMQDAQDFMRKVKLRNALEMWEEEKEERERVTGKPLHKQKMVMPYPVKTSWWLQPSREVTLKGLRNAVKPIAQAAAKACPDCPMNIASEEGGTMGCYSAIRYPISEAAEQFLIDQFQPSQGANSYLPHHILSNNIDGLGFDMRRGPMPDPSEIKDPARMPPMPLVLSPKAPRKEIGEGTSISTSQILDFMIGCQPIVMPISCLGFLNDFKALDLDDGAYIHLNALVLMWERMRGAEGVPQEKLTEMRAAIDEILLPANFLLAPQADDDPGIHGFKSFLYFCYVSLGSGAVLLVDG